MVPLATLLATFLQAAPQRPLEGLANGAFESTLALSTHVPGTSPLDAEGWVGGGGLIFGQGGQGNALQFSHGSTPFVYQRVACPPGRGSSAVLGARARLTMAGDEAWITLTEGRGHHTSMAWALAGLPAACGTWSFQQSVAGSWSALAPGQYSAQGNLVTWGRSTLASNGASDALLATWTAALPGTVRFVARLPRIDHASVDLLHEIRVGPSLATSQPVRSDVIRAVDGNGTVVRARCAVTPGTSLFLIVTRLGTTDPVTFEWHPLVAYEGRRLTWRFASQSAGPAATADQAWIHVQATPGSWTVLDAVDAGAEFAARFGQPPVPPLEIEVSPAPWNQRPIEVDEVSCSVAFDSALDRDLREEVLAEARWSSNLSRLARDRDTSFVPGHAGPGPWQLGPRPTPWVCHAMKVVSGPAQAVPDAQGRVIGLEPLALWALLPVVYDEQDYLDWSWIREREGREVGPAGLLWPRYDCLADEFVRNGSETTDTSAIERLVAAFEHTRDVSFLDRAFTHAEVACKTGVYSLPGSPHEGLILDEGYVVETGQNPLAALRGYWRNPAMYTRTFSGAAAVLHAYSACRRYDRESGAPPRYDPRLLARQLEVLRRAAGRAAAIKLHPHGAWAGVWHNSIGAFNDGYGYLGWHALRGIRRLEGIGGTLSRGEQELHDLLLRDIVTDGARFYLPLWEQQLAGSEDASGDQARTWPMFAFVAREVSDPFESRRIGEQVLRAGRNALRYQYRGGIWVTGNQDAHQMVDVAGTFSTPNRPPAMYVNGIAQGLSVQGLGAEDHRDLVSALVTMLRTTVTHFRRPYGYAHHVLSPATADEPGGVERRTIENFLMAIEHLEPSPIPPPEIRVEPASLQPPTPAGATFRFTLHAPAATSAAELTAALAARTRVARWSMVAGEWKRTGLWPEQPALFGTPVVDFPNRTIVLPMAQPLLPGAGEFKLEVRTWDAEGRWDRDTSWQPGW